MSAGQTPSNFGNIGGKTLGQRTAIHLATEARWRTASFGAAGLVAGFAGAVIGGLDMGDTGAMTETTLWALLFATLAGTIGLGVGMTVRHSAGAISGFLVWWFVIENLLALFEPAKLTRFLPFVTGYRLLAIGSDFDTPEAIAVALTRGQNALVFAGYSTVALVLGTVLLYRRDTN